MPDAEFELLNRQYGELLEELEACPFTIEDARYFQGLSTDARLHVLSVDDKPVAYWDVTVETKRVFGDIVVSARYAMALESMIDVVFLARNIQQGLVLEQGTLDLGSDELEITRSEERRVGKECR